MSRSDDKKFYIHTGTKTLHLRAETSTDRNDWVMMLNAAKEMFPRDSQLIGVVTPSEEITISTDKLRKKLLEFGISEEKVKESEDVMLAEFSVVKEQLKVMQQRRLTLLERLKLLEVHYYILYWELQICYRIRSALFSMDIDMALDSGGFHKLFCRPMNFMMPYALDARVT